MVIKSFKKFGISNVRIELKMVQFVKTDTCNDKDLAHNFWYWYQQRVLWILWWRNMTVFFMLWLLMKNFFQNFQHKKMCVLSINGSVLCMKEYGNWAFNCSTKSVPCFVIFFCYEIFIIQIQDLLCCIYNFASVYFWIKQFISTRLAKSLKYLYG